MSSTIAFLLCLLFILIAVSSEFKRTLQASIALWLSLFWMIICTSRSVGQWINYSSSTILSEGDYLDATLDGSAIDQISLGILFICGLFVLLKRKTDCSEILKENKVIFAFYLYLGISVLWSDIINISFRRWVRLLGGLIMVLVVLSEPEPFEAMKSLFRKCAYILIPLSILFIKYFPRLGIAYTWDGTKMWTGVALQKNGLGHLCLVSAFFFFWSLATTWRSGDIKRQKMRSLADIVFFLMSIWLLAGSHSATSIGVLVVGMSIYILLASPLIRNNIEKLGIILFLIVTIFLVLQLTIGIIEPIVTNLGRNMSFTDRTPLWKALIHLGLQEPFFGYGYGGFWYGQRLEFLWDAVYWHPKIGHNGYLELFAAGGFMALVFLVGIVITAYLKIKKTFFYDFDYGAFRLPLLIMILIANVTESSFAMGRDFLWFVFLLIAMDTPKAKTFEYVEILSQPA